MNKTHHYHHEEMALYIEGRLEEEKRRVFEERLKNDNDFREAFEEYKRNSSIIEQNALAYTPKAIQQQEDLAQTLNVFGKQYFSEDNEDELIIEPIDYETNPEEAYQEIITTYTYPESEIQEIKKSEVSLVRYVKRSLAACFFCVFFTSPIIYSNIQCTNQKLVDNFYQKTSGTRGQLRSASNNPTILINANKLYHAKKYQKVIDELGVITPKQQEYIEAQFLSAHCFMGLKSYIQAIQSFEIVIQSSRKYRENAQWNQVLAYIGNNEEDTPKFQQKLNDILKNEEHVYFEKATNLKSSLNSLFRKLVWS